MSVLKTANPGTPAQRAAAHTELMERMRALIPTDTEVSTLVSHISASGAFRLIRVFVATIDTYSGRPAIIEVTSNVATLLGYSLDTRGGLRITGAGMDMGYHVVYRLAAALHSDGYTLVHRAL